MSAAHKRDPVADPAGLYLSAADNAFGWARIRRQEPGTLSTDGITRSSEEAEAWLDEYLGGLASGTMVNIVNRPGSPLHLIGLAFANMAQSADEWEKWGYRLTAAHDMLVAQRDGQTA